MSGAGQVKRASLEELKAEYVGLLQTAGRFCSELKRQIEALVTQNPLPEGEGNGPKSRPRHLKPNT